MYQKPLISVNNLNYYFGHGGLRRQILWNINLGIKPGEIVILSGPSGSGKTTLLTLIGGLRTVSEGSLKVFGQELRGASDAKLMQIRRHIGYIFQAHNSCTKKDSMPVNMGKLSECYHLICVKHVK